MAYNTKAIVKDFNEKPVPQYYNPTDDVYEVLQGKSGANRVLLYTEAGQAIDLVALIATIVTAINNTGTTQIRAGTNNIGKVDVNTSTLPTGASTSAKQDEVKTLLSNVITELGKPVKLHELNDLVSAIEDIYSKDETKTLYLNSNEAKPTSNRKKGDKVFEIDTGEVHMWNGSSWGVI